MRKETRNVHALAAIDPTWRVIIEQRLAANRHWRHARRDIMIAELMKREPGPAFALPEISKQLEILKH